jgi:hypothetical protein
MHAVEDQELRSFAGSARNPHPSLQIPHHRHPRVDLGPILRKEGKGSSHDSGVQLQHHYQHSKVLYRT